MSLIGTGENRFEGWWIASDENRFEGWWLAPGWFAVGSHPARLPGGLKKNLTALISEGFQYFIDLTERKEHFDTPEMNRLHGTNYPDYDFPMLLDCAPENFDYEKLYTVKFPIPDATVPSDLYMEAILDNIGCARCEGLKVYMHCGWAIGRAPLVAGCWQKRYGMSTENVLKAFPKRWNHVLPYTNEQLQMIKRWKG